MIKKKLIEPDKLFGAEKVFDYFKVNGKYYEHDAKDGKIMMREVPKKKVDEHLKKAKELAKELKKNLEFNLRTLNTKQFRKIMEKIFSIEKVCAFSNERHQNPNVWVEWILQAIENDWLELQMGGFRVKINNKSITFFPDFSFRLNLDEEDIKNIKNFKNKIIK